MSEADYLNFANKRLELLGNLADAFGSKVDQLRFEGIVWNDDLPDGGGLALVGRIRLTDGTEGLIFFQIRGVDKALWARRNTSEGQVALRDVMSAQMANIVRSEAIKKAVDGFQAMTLTELGGGVAGATLPAVVKIGAGVFVAAKAVANFSDELTISGDLARARLRNALGLARGNADEAHHLIPVGLRDHDVVQRAARGGFNFNGVDNGVAMSFDRHRGVNIFHHNKYNDAIRSRLERELRNNPNMTDAQAADFLRSYTAQLRNAINNTRGRLR